MAATKTSKASSKNRSRISPANNTLVLPEDSWRQQLDIMGPFAGAEKLEAHLAAAPEGCEDAHFVRGYVANQRMGVVMSSDQPAFDD